MRYIIPPILIIGFGRLISGKVYRQKNRVLDKIKAIVEDVLMSEDCGMTQSTLGNLQKHTKLCLVANGDHFPHLCKDPINAQTLLLDTPVKFSWSQLSTNVPKFF